MLLPVPSAAFDAPRGLSLGADYRQHWELVKTKRTEQGAHDFRQGLSAAGDPAFRRTWRPSRATEISNRFCRIHSEHATFLPEKSRYMG